MRQTEAALYKHVENCRPTICRWQLFNCLYRWTT